MRRLVPALVLALTLSLLGSTDTSAKSLSGLWKEVSTSKHKASYVIFSQDGKKIYVACYWEHRGTKVVWHGQGTRNGNRVFYRLKHTRAPSSWGKNHTHTLRVTSGGKMLVGTWRDKRGKSGPLKFVKVK